MTKAPGKAFRSGISLIELMEVFPTEDAARAWFEATYFARLTHWHRCKAVALALSGKRLRYQDLIADNGLPSGAGS